MVAPNGNGEAITKENHVFYAPTHPTEKKVGKKLKKARQGCYYILDTLRKV